jgi:hypothetical protein
VVILERSEGPGGEGILVTWNLELETKKGRDWVAAPARLISPFFICRDWVYILLEDITPRGTHPPPCPVRRCRAEEAAADRRTAPDLREAEVAAAVVVVDKQPDRFFAWPH